MGPNFCTYGSQLLHVWVPTPAHTAHSLKVLLRIDLFLVLSVVLQQSINPLQSRGDLNMAYWEARAKREPFYGRRPGAVGEMAQGKKDVRRTCGHTDNSKT